MIDQAYPCPCGGSNDYCGCQDFLAVNVTQGLPSEVMCWRDRKTLDHVGTWATTRYPEDAVAYVRKDDFERVMAAAKLGLQMAEANDLWNTAETIREALEITPTQMEP